MDDYHPDLMYPQLKDVLSFIYDGVVEVDDFEVFLINGVMLEISGIIAELEMEVNEISDEIEIQLSNEEYQILRPLTASFDDPVFNVAWTNRNDTFAHGIKCLYKKQHQFDLTLVTKDGRELEAHRTILSIASSKIREMVKGLPKMPQPQCEFVLYLSLFFFVCVLFIMRNLKRYDCIQIVIQIDIF